MITSVISIILFVKKHQAKDRKVIPDTGEIN
jgi:hypothetical protein